MAKLGRVASLATSYDIAFLHSVLAALEGAPARRLPCTALPFRKVNVRELSPASQRWLAAINILLLGAKCQDDVADEGSWKGKLGLAVLSRRLAWAEQVMEESGFPTRVVTDLPRLQALEEARPDTSLEALAMPTSRMLGEVFAHAARLLDSPERAVPLRHLGQGLGAAIYIKDALDDLDKDRRRGRFNAIQASQGGPGQLPKTVPGSPSVPGHTYALTAMRREVGRATAGLAALRLDGAERPLQHILASLAAPPAAPVQPLARLRQRRKAWGGCDCGGCDCAGCDCGDCSACGDCGKGCGECCDACNTCDCNCNCPGCEGCGSGNSSGNNTAIVVAQDAVSPAVAKPALPCPACGNPLEAQFYGGVEIDECLFCCGVWLDHEELEALAASNVVPERLLRRKPMSVTQVRPEGTRPCPHCADFMSVVTLKGTRVDVCAKCKGLFLDQGELNGLLDSV